MVDHDGQPDLFGAPPTRTAAVDLDPDLDQWFTPGFAADLLVADALRAERGHRVLEPSAGAGAMLGAIGPGHDALGVEIDPRMAAAARAATGREVVAGDLRTVDLGGRTFTAIVGNPPFDAAVIDRLVERSEEWLEEGGVVGLVLPAHIPASSSRIERWSKRFAIETRLLPRSLFPRLTLPLTWNRMVRSDRRTLVGLFLFDEAADVHAMPPPARRALQGGATWREVVAQALASLGGEAGLADIYRAVEPRRRSENKWWRDKTRQILQERATFERTGEHRWRLAA